MAITFTNIIFDEIDTKPEVGQFTQDEPQAPEVEEEEIEEPTT